MIEIFIPHKFTTLNEYVNAERSNKFAGSKIKKKETELASRYFKKLKEEIQTPCDVHFIWNFKTYAQDGDNISYGKKFILDGAVKAGKLTNDNLKHIQGFKDDFRHDKVNDGVLVKFISNKPIDK